MATSNGKAIQSNKPDKGQAIALKGMYTYTTEFTSPITITDILQPAPVSNIASAKQWVLSASVKIKITNISKGGAEIVPTVANIGPDGKLLPQNQQLGYQIIGGAKSVSEGGSLQVQIAPSGYIRTEITLDNVVTTVGGNLDGWQKMPASGDSRNHSANPASSFDERLDIFTNGGVVLNGEILLVGKEIIKDINAPTTPPKD